MGRAERATPSLHTSDGGPVEARRESPRPGKSEIGFGFGQKRDRPGERDRGEAWHRLGVSPAIHRRRS